MTASDCPGAAQLHPDTTFGAYAKRIVAVMAGLALVTILTLVGMEWLL